MTADALPSETRLGRTALRVADLAEMTTFYRDVVGLGVQHWGETTAVLGAGDTPLLVLEEATELPPRPDASAGLYHNAFRVPTRAALGDALQRIRAHAELTGASDHLVSEALYLSDPEHNGVEVYRDFPRDEWPTSADGTIELSTEPLDLDTLAAAAVGDDRAPPATDLGHVHLEVTSLDAFRSVYVERLGFEEQTTMPAASFVSAGGYHHHIGANTWQRRTEPASGRGLAWVEVVLPNRGDLTALRDRLAGSQCEVADSNDGITMGDPDEIALRFRSET